MSCLMGFDLLEKYLLFVRNSVTVLLESWDWD